MHGPFFDIRKPYWHRTSGDSPQWWVFIRVGDVMLPTYSSYPGTRVKADDEDKKDVGVMGTVSLIQNVTLSTQPICSFDWNSDKVCVCA